MSEQIRLYDQDFSAVLFETDDRAAANQFLRDSGKDWLNMVIDFGSAGQDWRSRWSGRVVLHENATISTVGSSEYLKYMTLPPNPFS